MYTKAALSEVTSGLFAGIEQETPCLKKKYYITTPIYHLGMPNFATGHVLHDHCRLPHGSTVRAATTSFFLTGSDEHGQKIQRAAEAKGVKPIEYVDEIVALFQQLWKKLNISNDDFIRTTEKRHEKVVQALMQKSYDNGDIYKGGIQVAGNVRRGKRSGRKTSRPKANTSARTAAVRWNSFRKKRTS